MAAFRETGLMDGERIDSALSLTEGLGVDHAGDSDVILLTDRRIIQVHADSRSQKAVFLSIRGIDSIEITANREGYRAFLWGAVSLFVAVMLWRLWDHEVGSALGAVAVALMGAYLVVDRLMSAGNVRARFRAGSSQIQFDLRGDRASRDVYAFASRLFELKEERGKDNGRPMTFAPR